MCPFTALKSRENKTEHHPPNKMPASRRGPRVVLAERWLIYPHPWPSTEWMCPNRLPSEYVIVHVPGTALETVHIYFFPSSRGRHRVPQFAVEETDSQEYNDLCRAMCMGTGRGRI